jgi:hypothetical protein
LFKNENAEEILTENEVADLFTDLNLDQIIEGALLGNVDHRLEELFRSPLSDIESIEYRQDVASDIERGDVFGSLTQFSRKMDESARYLRLESELNCKERKDGWFLEGALSYAAAVSNLAADLSVAELRSDGMLKWRKWLVDHTSAKAFKDFAASASGVKEKLSEAKYTVRIKENGCTVRRFAGESDHESEIMRTFAKFQESSVRDRLSRPKAKPPGMNQVKERILECVAKLYPDVFKALSDFRAKFADFRDERILTFNLESRFIMAYLEHIAPLRKSGLKFCYPEMTTLKAEIDAKDVFDLALARKLLNKDAEIVLNNFNLRERECVMVVSGPNQGGKTTFARAFGQTHYLAKLGLPVPGARARLLLCDKILTHFEREEEISNLRGKLQDDLTRINELLRKATENSIIILNEIFNSTTLKDGVFLGERILGKIAERGSICLLVTFMEELSRGKNGDGEPTGERISLVSVVHPDNPAGRTYKIVRKPADGRAYAQVMAEKHHLTYEEVKKRIQRGVED